MIGHIGDKYDQSFQLSPGRKSLSMSNLVGDEEDGDRTRTSSVISSCIRSSAGSNPNISSQTSNLHRMKAFLSSKNLDHVQISLTSKQRRSGSEGELAVRSKFRECLHPDDPGMISAIVKKKFYGICPLN